MRYSILFKSVLKKSCYLTTALVLSVLIAADGAAEPAAVIVNNEEETQTVPGLGVAGTTGTQDCLLAKQLKKDPYVRAEYDAVIEASRSAGNNLSVEGMYGNIRTANFSELPSFSNERISAIFDPITMECLACHDGITAKSAKYRISDGNIHRVKSIETIKGAHPIGMDYDRFSRNSSEYAPAEILPAEMVLMDGKVGCATCHNLLDSKRMYLVVDNSSSGLCLSCHNK